MYMQNACKCLNNMNLLEKKVCRFLIESKLLGILIFANSLFNYENFKRDSCTLCDVL